MFKWLLLIFATTYALSIGFLRNCNKIFLVMGWSNNYKHYAAYITSLCSTSTRATSSPPVTSPLSKLNLLTISSGPCMPRFVFYNRLFSYHNCCISQSVQLAVSCRFAQMLLLWLIHSTTRTTSWVPFWAATTGMCTPNFTMRHGRNLWMIQLFLMDTRNTWSHCSRNSYMMLNCRNL